MLELIEGKSYVFSSPSKIIFGLGAAKSVNDEVKRLGGSKVLIVTDSILLKADVIRPVLESLETAEIPYSIYDGVEPDPPTELVDEATDKFRKEECNLVVGIGGASSLDVAKGVSVVATNAEKVMDVCGFEQAAKRGAPKILLSTTHTAGGELSPYVIMHMSREDHSLMPIVSEYAIPEVAIMDPLLTVSMPPTVTLDTGFDTLATAIEALVAANAHPFSDVFAEPALKISGEYLPVAWAKGSNLTARYFMCLAATFSGLAFVSSSVGAVHALSYAVGSAYHLTHGRSLAVLLPHVMRFNLPGNPARYARAAALMGKDIEGLSTLEAAQLAVEAAEEILETVGVSTRLRDYGASEDDLQRLTEETMEMAGFFSYNPRDFDEERTRAIYQAAY
ncbi:MAG: iron-containing alcohol dehydrogenase [Candidatus Lindowbacteria bacterium]|nr:iron-containing alcohol dehydrogenase [Candidatus Lindowbacteria bacterium]